MKEVNLGFLQNGGEYELCGSKIKSGKWFLETYPYLDQLFGDLGVCAIIVDKNSPENEYKSDFDVYIFPRADEVGFCDDGEAIWPCCSIDRYVLISSRKLAEPYVEYVHDDLNDEEGAYDTKAEFDSAFTITGHYKGLTISTLPERTYYNSLRVNADSYCLSLYDPEESAFKKLTTLFSKMH